MLRAEEAYEGYERAWNEPGRAAALLEKVWAPEGVYADDDVPDGCRRARGARRPHRRDT